MDNLDKRIGEITTESATKPDGFDQSPGEPLTIKETDITGEEARCNLEQNIWEGTKQTSTKGYRLRNFRKYQENFDRIFNNKGGKSATERLVEKFGEAKPPINPATGKPYGYYDRTEE